MKPITESHIEQSAIETLQALGWAYVNGKDISPEGIACERESFSHRDPSSAGLGVCERQGHIAGGHRL
ncbi:MAG: hypothetical protein K9J37_02430 [Saprospiraceae bacterium]|nr:hypothetical protein [Saprospiraceae bacterium]MCF8248736.1 hypothetical protein [Saprospiraceae bacterium]MCF8278774.1 hypothetical protein [Bacteroidales bacterium]MCF8310574.1 hypothetical protein [Saprospiraceae bacterium]MCF8439133.1 hypothetical protein [Saprospiraceae bacterium]